jgi:hypothetical protein
MDAFGNPLGTKYEFDGGKRPAMCNSLLG